MCRNQRLIDFDLHVWQYWNCFNAQKTMYIFDKNNFKPVWRSISRVIGPQIWPDVMLGQKYFTEIQNLSVFKCLSCTLYFFCGANLFDYVFVYIHTCFKRYTGEFLIFPDFVPAFARLRGRFCEFWSFLWKQVCNVWKKSNAQNFLKLP